MRSFFKIFLATLLALAVFTVIVIFFIVTYIGGIANRQAPKVLAKSVLVLDLGQHYAEQLQHNPLTILSGEEKNVPGLYDVVRLVRQAKVDDRISGIYLVANNNANSFAASEEIRNALKEFKTSGKFVLAHGDILTQQAYSVANIADKVYVSPQGFFDWAGYSVEYIFLKGALDKLQIQPQIFYAGKFKSATEPLRADQMSPENELQTSVWLNDLYSDLLEKTSETRKVDTATLRELAVSGVIRTPKDALDNKLVDALWYDDELKDEIKRRIKIDKYDRINFITINTYSSVYTFSSATGGRIALIYAEGDIVDGEGSKGSISGEQYRNLIRKARLDKSIKAIVLRINTGGGSTLASESIWREMTLAKAEKPVVVSFGDVSASGGYYVSCAADSIFASKVTITGSIGVFGIIPNMQSFFKDKVGVTFDGVKTGPYADLGAVYRPLEENERRMVQTSIDMIYSKFKQRVADGRKKDTAYIETIAQGRVWTGARAREIGLVDYIGGIDDALQCAARMAKLTQFNVRGYPEPQTLWEQLMGKKEVVNYKGAIESEIGADNYKVYLELKRIREMTGQAQARLPFQFFIH